MLFQCPTPSKLKSHSVNGSTLSTEQMHVLVSVACPILTLCTPLALSILNKTVS